MSRKFWKNTEVGIFRVLMFFATSIIAIALILIIISILYKGLPSLTWQILTEIPKGGYYFGKEGGILNAIIGSLYLSFGATILSFIVSLPLALYINVHRIKQKKLVNIIRFFLDLLWGVPSIVYGAFGFTIMIYLGLRTSLLAGIITVTLFIIPIMVRSMDEIFKTVPKGLLESALSLGSTRSETAFKVVARQCIPGIITAILLAFGRAIGDAAAILFTTGYTDYIPTSLYQPTATLPLSIFFQLGSPIPEVQNRAYASAVILTVIILIISILSRILSRKYYKERIK
ncbi:MAG: phosphate ABC transporter permease PstA [Bacteroidales bacterium]|jgi:phosphate transport system permease protein|nr:phosphate ABC transporter permease PstA [Bacteroidales bacterium]